MRRPVIVSLVVAAVTSLAFVACSGGASGVSGVSADDAGQQQIQRRVDGGATGDGRTCSWEGTAAYAGSNGGSAGPYNVGESFKSLDGCNDCSCTAEGIVCTARQCAPPPACPSDANVCSDSSVAPGACFTDGGALDPAMRGCTTNGDCVIANVPQDCCGRVHAAGVNKSSAARAKTCGDARSDACGARGCFAEGTVADDGSSDRDAGTVTGATVSVTCSARGLCETTFTPLPPNDPSCPAAYAPGAATCNVGLTCRYPEGRCTCILSSGCAVPQEPHDEWTCTPHRTDGCPDDAPSEGTSCQTGKSCAYTNCCSRTFTCPDGKWVAGGLACPG